RHMPEDDPRQFDPELPPNPGGCGVAQLVGMPLVGLPPGRQFRALVVRQVLPLDSRERRVGERATTAVLDRVVIGAGGVPLAGGRPGFGFRRSLWEGCTRVFRL